MPILVVCAILIDQGRVLLAQRPEGKHLALKWEFPGGKVEPDESPEQALIRELQEELGCTVEITAALPHSLHTYDRGTIEMIPFICSLDPRSPAPQAHEHASLTWVAPNDIADFDLAPADWPVLNNFKDYLRG